METSKTHQLSMDIPHLQSIERNLSCCGQIDVHHIPTIKKLGFKTLVCTRPDHEEISQPLSAQIKKIAEKYGISYIDIPFRSSLNEVEKCKEFCRIFEEQGKLHPTLAFCRTGSRALLAWYTYKQHEYQD